MISSPFTSGALLSTLHFRIFFLTPKGTVPLRYQGGWLFTSPDDMCGGLLQSQVDVEYIHYTKLVMTYSSAARDECT